MAVEHFIVQRPKVAALAVVLQDEKVLLVRRKNEPNAGLWGFPGGHLELGETVFQCAQRELLEETGIVGSPEKHLTNIDLIAKNDCGEVTHHYVLCAVLCSFVSGVVNAGDDAAEANWYNISDVTNSRMELSESVEKLCSLVIA